MDPSERTCLIVDHELLSRLDAQSPRSEWERVLRRTGLVDLELVGEQGRDLAELRRALTSWTEAPSTAGKADAGAFVTVGVVSVIAGLAFSSTLPLLAGAGIVLARVLLRTPTLTAPSEPERAVRALRRFLSRTFVETSSGVIVENTPHRMYLALRLAEVEAAVRAADGHSEQLRELRLRIAQTNTELGRPAEDAETTRITTALYESDARRERVVVVRDLLRQRLTDLDRQLAYLRVHVERRALSERLARLTEGDAQEPVDRIAAEIEVDVVEVEAQVRSLTLEASHSDERLRALLEVVGAGRGRS